MVTRFSREISAGEFKARRLLGSMKGTVRVPGDIISPIGSHPR